MNKNQVRERFHIYTGYKRDGAIEHQLQAGEAYLIENERKSYYVVKMWAFPTNVFYLTRVKDNPHRFTVFAKKMGDETNPVFRRPVGQAYLSQDLKSFLEIQFTFPREKVFMSLYPASTVIDSLFSQNQDEDESLYDEETA
jgi:hypothetical protein